MKLREKKITIITISNMFFDVRAISIVLFAISIFNINATITPRDKGKKVKVELELNAGPVDKNVFERGLIEDEPFAKDILVESGTYYENTSIRLFKGPTLGFVTPWNNHGYDIAKVFGAKFDMISPVWFQVLHKGNNEYEIGGMHDIDLNWIKDVREAGPEEQLSN